MQANRFTSTEAAYAFILAGRSYVTLKSAATGTHYTYRVTKADSRNPDKELWFVALLTAPEIYTYMGVIKQEPDVKPDRLHRTTKSRIMPDAPGWKAFDWVIGKLFYEDRIPEQLEVWHDGRCGRCARQLTHPDSIERGIGPECIKHFRAEAA